MKIINFISNKIFRIKRECWIKKLRKRLKNRNFTLISNNCCAGIIYSDLGLQFTSPTINLYFLPEEYLLFVKNLKAYVEGVMVDVSDPNIASFPIGSLNPNDCSLPAIRIYSLTPSILVNDTVEECVDRMHQVIQSQHDKTENCREFIEKITEEIAVFGKGEEL